MRRNTSSLIVLLTLAVGGAGTAVAADGEPGGNREFYIVSANPDGTVNCAKWCGPTEPCC